MRILALAAILASTTITAQAYDKSAIVGGIGESEVFGTTNTGVLANVEYRAAAYAPEQFFGISNVSWIAGAEADTNASAYGYAGLLYDYALTDRISITPSVSAGLYHQGEGKDLGGEFEFRDSIEVNYKLDDGSRVGVALNHKSSAGINSRNPGTETLQAIYSVNLE